MNTTEEKPTEFEAKHTPGPWQAGLNIPTAAKNNTDPCLVWSGTKLVIDCRSKWVGRSEAEANARLIAAAPELLESLREVVAISDRKHNAWDKAHAAIAKATGGAQ